MWRVVSFYSFCCILENIIISLLICMTHLLKQVLDVHESIITINGPSIFSFELYGLLPADFFGMFIKTNSLQFLFPVWVLSSFRLQNLPTNAVVTKRFDSFQCNSY